PTHMTRATADVRFDATAQDAAANAFGTFTFASLADLAANRPSSYTRTTGAPTRQGGAWNAFAAVGDVWRASPSLQLRYGLRVEGTEYVRVPARNPAVEQAFGVRTDHAPNTVGVSPRAGFVYRVPGARGRPRGSTPGGARARRR